ncbi:MAG TPA: hypothetical protein VI759_04450 [Dehalococcoidia bacterium]|nr:hypothetical protein [Dehalococcoidia bacterium]
MTSPFFVTRLAAFTVALLLLTESVEPSSGWYVVLLLMTLMTMFDLLSMVAFTIAFLLIIGVIHDGQGANIALSIFTGASLLKSLLRRRGGGEIRMWRHSFSGRLSRFD